VFLGFERKFEGGGGERPLFAKRCQLKMSSWYSTTQVSLQEGVPLGNVCYSEL
jgi:hypothetical protein